MYMIRAIRQDDLQGLYDLASKSKWGLTTLPADIPVLTAKIKKSEQSFAGTLDDPEPFFLMVLENTDTGEVMGSTAIFGRVGLNQPFYNYKLLKITQTSPNPPMRVETDLLTMANDYSDTTELGTLFLHPEMRGKGPFGRFLSKVRFMLIAQRPEVFAEIIIAELRGYVDDNGRSPFWDALGRHFFQMEFLDADRINGMGNNQFINDLMPKHPIYTNLLPEEARANIGRPHDNSVAAMRLLMSEGFRFRGAVDIFDSGPLIEARRDDIYAVRTAKTQKLVGVTEHHDDATLRMVCNRYFARFRAVLSVVEETNDGVRLPQETIDALDLSMGDEVLHSGMEGKKE